MLRWHSFVRVRNVPMNACGVHRRPRLIPTEFDSPRRDENVGCSAWPWVLDMPHPDCVLAMPFWLIPLHVVSDVLAYVYIRGQEVQALFIVKLYTAELFYRPCSACSGITVIKCNRAFYIWFHRICTVFKWTIISGIRFLYRCQRTIMCNLSDGDSACAPNVNCHMTIDEVGEQTCEKSRMRDHSSFGHGFYGTLCL